MDILETAGGSFKLSRWPVQERDALRAWDAADEYLLQEVSQRDDPQNLLLVNDSFGALACALSGFGPTLWSDSVTALNATAANLQANNLSSLGLEHFVPMCRTPQSAQGFDCILIKIPRSLALLEYQLEQLRPQMDAGTTVIGAGMVKYLPKAAIELFEKIIGPATTSLAKKKARLVYSQVAVNPGLSVSALSAKDYQLFDGALTISSHPGVFSQGKLDIGSRFFLENFPRFPAVESAIDLACGNGVLGIALQHFQPDIKLSFCDESYLAIESARQNYRRAFSARQYEQARFDVMDCLATVAADSADLIICNPPFHQQNAVSDQIAKRMFVEPRRCLQQSGELWIVANRHLGHHVLLKRLFGNCQTVAGNHKFVVLRAVRR